uniref:Sulfate_transp domain-containing protein n=1 Tax=Angiostrongylus cantonensis TaxID=6313 RepID=A0A0K0DBJ5_ANGCA
MHVPQGTFAVVALMTGKVVHKMTAVDSISSDHLTNLTASVIEHTPIQIASTLTVLIGLIQVLIAFLGLDFVTTYFSDELVGGFTTGASTHVFVTQLSDVLGISGLPRRHGLANLILKIYDFCGAIKRTNLITLCLSTVTMFVLILGKDYVNPWMKKKFHCSVPIPFELIVVSLDNSLGNGFITI